MNDPHAPYTLLQELASACLDEFVEDAGARGMPINRAVFFVVGESREACTAGYNFDEPDEMLAFLLSYARQLGEAIGVQVAVVYPDEN